MSPPLSSASSSLEKLSLLLAATILLTDCSACVCVCVCVRGSQKVEPYEKVNAMLPKCFMTVREFQLSNMCAHSYRAAIEALCAHSYRATIEALCAHSYRAAIEALCAHSYRAAIEALCAMSMRHFVKESQSPLLPSE